MKKEKWLLKEIDSWQREEIITEETAGVLKSMYQPKKSISLLMVLFSIIGSLLIGMGIVLVSANNWWYSLPIAVRTFIGFLPLFISQFVVFYVYKNKMHSTAFRESAALLNMAGVFASIALVGQIFHLPGDFTNYMLVCGILFLPTMLLLNALSPLIIYYWSAINGGIYFSDELGIIISVVMFAIGAIYALKKCDEKNGKSIYLSLITVISGFSLILVSALRFSCELTIILYGYALLLLSTAGKIKGCDDDFTVFGRLCFLVLTLVLTYQGLWEYTPEFDSPVFMIMTVLVGVFGVAFFLNNLAAKSHCMFSAAAFILLILRGLWCICQLSGFFALQEDILSLIFMLISNGILLVLSIMCIAEGVKRIDLYSANTGMIILCTLIILRFFDSELPLAARGVVFLILGAGFLLFNLYLVKTKKKIKEETL